MHQSFQQALANDYRADLLAAIEDAKQGGLPPSKQEYCFGEIARAKGTGAFPLDGDRLLGQLRDILSENQQISELESETAEVTAFGGTLLLFYYLDSHTLLELVEQPNGAGYDSFVFISSEKHGDNLDKTAEQARKYFQPIAQKADDIYNSYEEKQYYRHIDMGYMDDEDYNE